MSHTVVYTVTLGTDVLDVDVTFHPPNSNRRRGFFYVLCMAVTTIF